MFLFSPFILSFVSSIISFNVSNSSLSCVLSILSSTSIFTLFNDAKCSTSSNPNRNNLSLYNTTITSTSFLFIFSISFNSPGLL